MTAVRQLRHLRRAIHTDEALPDILVLGYSPRRLPRAHIVHAAHLRPLHCPQGARHLPGDWRAHLPGCQRGQHRGAHHVKPEAVRGKAAAEGREGGRGGRRQAQGATRGGATDKGSARLQLIAGCTAASICGKGLRWEGLPCKKNRSGGRGEGVRICASRVIFWLDNVFNSILTELGSGLI